STPRPSRRVVSRRRHASSGLLTPLFLAADRPGLRSSFPSALLLALPHMPIAPASAATTGAFVPTDYQPFVTLKGGFMDFRINDRPPFYPLPTFVSSLDTLRADNVN